MPEEKEDRKKEDDNQQSRKYLAMVEDGELKDPSFSVKQKIFAELGLDMRLEGLRFGVELPK